MCQRISRTCRHFVSSLVCRTDRIGYRHLDDAGQIPIRHVVGHSNLPSFDSFPAGSWRTRLVRYRLGILCSVEGKPLSPHVCK